MNRLRVAVFLAFSLGIATFATKIEGKDTPIDIGIQSTTDVQGEVAPCG